MRWEWMNGPAAVRRVAAWSALALASWLLLAPARTFDELGVWFSFQDKVVHFLLFLLLAGLMRWSLSAPWSWGWRRTTLAVALLAYGAGMECLQPCLAGAGRRFEWMDMVLNSAGTVAGVWTCERLARKA